jgi:hypothetical protein
MSLSKGRFKVSKHNCSVTVYPYSHAKSGKSGWRFGWRDQQDGRKWKYITRPTKEEAKEAALSKLDEIAWGKLAWNSLPEARRQFLTAIDGDTHPDDEERVREFAYSLRRKRERDASTVPATEHSGI